MKAPTVRVLTAVLGAALLLCGCHNSAPTEAAARSPASADPASKANLFIGTESGAPDFGTGGGAGNTHPAATLPFGMIQFGPDTWPSSDNFAAGYSYGDTRLEGFSLTRVSGAGCAIYQDVSILPTLRVVDRSPAPAFAEGLHNEFYPAFSHAEEAAEPGYYRVRLDPGTSQAIDVELSATERAGIACLNFPAAERATVLINAGASAMANSLAELRIDPEARRISGAASSGRFCYQNNRYTLYFAIEFDRAFTAHGVWEQQRYTEGAVAARNVALLPINYQPIPGGPTQIPGDPSGGAQAGAVLSFDTREAPVVRLRVSISYVSAEQALANLRAELDHWDLDAARRAARARWNAELSRIEIEGGSATEQRLFYTALYRALSTPNLFSDADGQYLGMDGAVHRSSEGPRYHNYSGWDIYRSQVPLLAMLWPERAAGLVRSLLAQADESGRLPKWSYANQHSNVMVGDPAAITIASSHAFGVRDFDEDAALRAMLRGASESGTSSSNGYVQRPGLGIYQSLGYIPLELNFPSGAAGVVSPQLIWGSTSTTLEYALADFAIGRYAAALGRGAEATAVAARAGNWRQLLNPASGRIETRLALGLFNPLHNPASDLGYVEGSGAQYEWFVPQDAHGLIAARGGAAVASRDLDAFFSELNAGPQSVRSFLGNEPGLSTPWLYLWTGEPDKTSAVVARALRELYSDTPGGMPGNDDLGTMSAWWVLAALGFNPAVPGTDLLALNAPLFPGARLHLPAGTLAISRSGDGGFVGSLARNGSAQTRAWLRYPEIAGGGRLDYRMSAAPAQWGAAAADLPPDFTLP